jgi:hypothetical protein
MARPKKEQTTNNQPEGRISDEDLIKILKPFADWAWGDPQIAQVVIDKYFRQVVNKE